MKTLLIFLYLFAFTVSSASAEYYFPADSTIIGKAEQYTVQKGDSLIELARKFDLGYNEITEANPGIDPFIPPAGASVQIPSVWIVPDVPERNGIVINISEMRLYFFTGKGTNMMTTFPIGVGDEGKETPLGEFKVTKKVIEPSWHVPKSIQQERPELPSIVPPGPENPLGSHALRLSVPAVLIHGTNRPWSLGRKATHGCIRLYPEDISKLFLMVRKGEKVTIVREPVKVAVFHNRVYMEVHNDENAQYLLEAVNALGKKKLLDKIDSKKMLRALREKSGIPVNISMDQPVTSDERVEIKLFPPDWTTDITQ